MSTERDFDRIARAWLDLMPDEAPDRAVASVLHAIEAMPQVRRSHRRMPWGYHRMNRYALLAATVVLATALLSGALFTGGQRSTTPSPNPSAPDLATPAPSFAAPTTGRPLVEELGRFAAGQVSSFGAALLTDGRVLIAGGVDTSVGQETLANAWLFDPDDKLITPIAPMTTPRATPLIVGLADGRALVLGGWEDPTKAEARLTAEIFDPVTGTFAATTGAPSVRIECPCGALGGIWAIVHTTLLPDGRVFIAGGTGPAATQADLYDPATDTFERVEIGCDAARGAQVLLADGRLLITCLAGRTGDFANRARLFDPATTTFTEVGQPTTSNNGNATLLPDGRVLFSGSVLEGGVDLYDPVTRTFTTLSMATRPTGGRHPGIDAGGGRFVFLGSPEEQSYLLDTSTMTFDGFARPGFWTADAVVPLDDGRVLTIGYRLEASLLDPRGLPS